MEAGLNDQILNFDAQFIKLTFGQYKDSSSFPFRDGRIRANNDRKGIRDFR